MEKPGLLEKFRFAMDAGEHKAFTYIAWTAPVYFILFSLFRSYVETALMEQYPMFSYYRGLHHILWNTTAALALMMTVQAFTGKETRKLMFMLFGVTFMLLPLIHSWVTRLPLELTYLQGDPISILRDIATFCLLNPKNRPLGLEIMLLGTGIGLLTWAITGSKYKGLGAFIASHLVLNLVAVHWVGLPSRTEALFRVNTELSMHPFQAIVYSMGAMAIILYAAGRQGLFRENALAWKRSFRWAGAGWIIYSMTASGAGWFHTPFDCFATGLPLFTAVAITVRMQQDGWQKSRSGVALLLLSALLVFQVLVMGPIYLGIQEHLTGPGSVWWIISPATG